MTLLVNTNLRLWVGVTRLGAIVKRYLVNVAAWSRASASRRILFGALVPLLCNGAVLAQSGPVLPDYLHIVSAAFIESGPVDAGRVAARPVSLRIVVKRRPDCGPGTPFLAYGALIDSDRDNATEAPGNNFDGLGVDARITARCDGVGAFTSPLGPVTVVTDPDTGETTFEIATRIGLLPAADFYWIAFATAGGQLARLPEAPDIARWAPLEILMY